MSSLPKVVDAEPNNKHYEIYVKIPSILDHYFFALAIRQNAMLSCATQTRKETECFNTNFPQLLQFPLFKLVCAG